MAAMVAAAAAAAARAGQRANCTHAGNLAGSMSSRSMWSHSRSCRTGQVPWRRHRTRSSLK
eukprot:scaffold16485_cov65-Phaeocystis_antarctica.AAC.4